MQPDFLLEEVDLIRALKSGGPTAHVQFFNLHKEDMKRMTRLRMDRLLSRRIDESDILQEAFIEYCDRVSKYVEDPRVPPVVWLRRLVRQVISRQNRVNLGAKCRDARREIYELSSAKINVHEFAASLSSVHTKLERLEMQDRLVTLINKMPVIEREILALVHFEQRTVRESAAELGINLEAAKKRYRRALNRLRPILEPDAPSLSNA